MGDHIKALKLRHLGDYCGAAVGELWRRSRRITVPQCGGRTLLHQLPLQSDFRSNKSAFIPSPEMVGSGWLYLALWFRRSDL